MNKPTKTTTTQTRASFAFIPIAFTRRLASPLLWGLTRYRVDQGFESEVRELLPCNLVLTYVSQPCKRRVCDDLGSWGSGVGG